MEEADLGEEDVDEAEVASLDQKTWNVGHVGEWGTCQESAQNPNASYATKKGIQHNFVQENQ